MRNDWVHKDELDLDVSHEGPSVDFTATGNKVILLDGQELEERVFKSLLEFHVFIVLSGLFDTIVDGVFEDLVP